jgi:sugar transferase (PEP-CTERM system associated)
LLVLLCTLSLLLGIAEYLFPAFMIGHGVYTLGIVILTFALLGWRRVYAVLTRSQFLQESVYVLGDGPRAEKLVSALRARPDLGIQVVGWSGALANTQPTREQLAEKLMMLVRGRSINRVIVALSDRRGRTPTRELLDARLSGIRVEEATSLLEKISGKIEVDSLHPSALIYSEGFDLRSGARFIRGLFSRLVALITLLITAPALPIVALAVKLSSPGPIIYRQKRVGRKGEVFQVYKFRTMRQDAEVNGATWATEDDPRVTRVGRFLRKTRLDELPQLWNVLKGEMRFCGPRPERPEFVHLLAEQIPYYHLRHLVAPGITGWAQVSYRYGSSIEDAKEKLQYDLYYVKHASLALDLLIMFETIKTIVLRRGAQ